jgi:hypothetical protein
MSKASNHQPGLTMRKLLLTTAALAALAAPANAQSALPRHDGWSMDGNLLLAICSPNAYPYDQSYCYGYLLATFSTLVLMDQGFRICVPQGVLGREMQAIVVRVLWSRPDIRHLAGAPLVAQIFQDVWNCPLGVTAQSQPPKPTEPPKQAPPKPPQARVDATGPSWLR